MKGSETILSRIEKLFKENPTTIFTVKAVAHKSNPQINYNYAKRAIDELVANGVVVEYVQYGKDIKGYMLKGDYE